MCDLYVGVGDIGREDVRRGDVGRKDVQLCGGREMVSCWHWSGTMAKRTVSKEKWVTGAPLLLDNFVACSLVAYVVSESKEVAE